MHSASLYPPGTSIASHSSEDPEVPNAFRSPSPRPASEDLAFSRSAAHYAVLVLASMIGTLIRLGLEALADCELDV
jgi:CrcB protein